MIDTIKTIFNNHENQNVNINKKGAKMSKKIKWSVIVVLCIALVFTMGLMGCFNHSSSYNCSSYNCSCKSYEDSLLCI
jgi:hypothetical protein